MKFGLGLEVENPPLSPQKTTLHVHVYVLAIKIKYMYTNTSKKKIEIYVSFNKY